MDQKSEKQAAFDLRMAARNERKAKAKAVSEDYEIDVMTALDDAEQEYGDNRVRRVDVAPGIRSVIVAFTAPLKMPIKHLRAVLDNPNAKATERTKCFDTIAPLAVVWPPKGQPGDYASTVDEYPACRGQIVSAALAVAGAVDQEDAGK